MNEVYRINAWRVYQSVGGYTIQNIDKNIECRWSRVTQRFSFRLNSFRVPISVERFIKTREGLLPTIQLEETLNLSSRTYGIEIECFHKTDDDIRNKVRQALQNVGIPCQYLGYTHTVTSSWKIVTDSSIRGGIGLEVVSPILKGEEGLEQIRKVTKVLNELGCRVNRSTGLHVHHGAQGFSQEKIKKVFKLYRENEQLFDSLVAPSRRGDTNQYCMSLRNHLELPDTRYTKVNYKSYAKYGTLEVRHHQGTLNAEKIINWIKLTQRVIERAEAYERSFQNLEEMIRFMGLREIENWFLERAEELSA